MVLCIIWFICVLAVFGFGFLSYCFGGSKCYVELCVFKYVSYFLILGLKYVKVVYCLLLSCLAMLVFCWFSILVFTLCMRWVGKLLFWATVCIFNHSLFLLVCVRGSESILFIKNLYAASFCSVGWLE